MPTSQSVLRPKPLRASQGSAASSDSVEGSSVTSTETMLAVQSDSQRKISVESERSIFTGTPEGTIVHRGSNSRPREVTDRLEGTGYRKGSNCDPSEFAESSEGTVLHKRSVYRDISPILPGSERSTPDSTRDNPRLSLSVVDIDIDSDMSESPVKPPRMKLPLKKKQRSASSDATSDASEDLAERELQAAKDLKKVKFARYHSAHDLSSGFTDDLGKDEYKIVHRSEVSIPDTSTLPKTKPKLTSSHSFSRTRQMAGLSKSDGHLVSGIETDDCLEQPVVEVSPDMPVWTWHRVAAIYHHTWKAELSPPSDMIDARTGEEIQSKMADVEQQYGIEDKNCRRTCKIYKSLIGGPTTKDRKGGS